MAYESGTSDEAIQVFVSYSRADTEFALDLVAGLQACGFEAFIDQEDIAPGEPWEQRLGNLIQGADTVVYILSPDSVVSEHCSWEIAESLRINKRILPVVWRSVEDTQVPAELSELNYTFFSGKQSYASGLRELSAALRVDHQWIREHTRLGALATRWSARGRSEALLLRGDELDAASEWAASQPRGAPALTDAQVDFIGASKAAADAAERAARNRKRGLLIAVSGVALAMAGLAGFSAFNWFEADTARAEAVSAEAETASALEQLETATTQLRAAYLRLSSDIALRAPATGNAPFEVKGGWFPVAADYAGSVARLQRGRQIVTGIVMNGEVIHPEYAGEYFLLTPRFLTEEELIAQDREFEKFIARSEAIIEAGAQEEPEETYEYPGEGRILEQRHVSPGPPTGMPEAEPEPTPAAQPARPPDVLEQRHLGTEPAGDPDGPILVSYPTLEGEEVFELTSEPIWRTPEELAAEPIFYVYPLSFEPPFGARGLWLKDFDCEGYKEESSEEDLFAVFGIDGLAVDSRESEELTLLITTGLDSFGPGALTYRHAVLKGAFGAPVFDLATGKVVGIHQGVDANSASPDGRIGHAEPILRLIDFIRDDVSIERRDEERTAPVCYALEEAE
ncbi:MAG: toll/interleukin-1 receptor domain-containing protein [Hyphomonadaceae bacterium]|nr:toll/interleukin-1 receptor domain-containing protein [Hyphomonadaceae bacterium]